MFEFRAAYFRKKKCFLGVLVVTLTLIGFPISSRGLAEMKRSGGRGARPGGLGQHRLRVRALRLLGLPRAARGRLPPQRIGLRWDYLWFITQ